MAASAVGSTVYSIYSGEQQHKAQKKGNAAQLRIAQESARLAETQFNKANPKKPNVAALMSANRMAGGSATKLTGPGGAAIDPGMLGRVATLGA